MKVTTKGQVTIPIEFREKTGIVPGSEIRFSLERGKLYLQKVKGEGRGKELIRKMTGQGNIKMTTDEIMALTRGED
ncbi:MAG TPA: AbrB/MazE/SpoVT family DNA-binding domain-containing protein [Candidatus Hydrogenedentes bacterium]|nr:AbrB/MazE/SpoVT family DNA-binding domain-containing protein [Candidatus Hydrogenedentota bacterium]